MDRAGDRIIKRFDYNRMVKQTTMPVIAVVKNTEDYPGKYVARLCNVDQPTNLVAVADTYEELLEAIPTGKMVRLEWPNKNDPVIVETWV